MIVGIILFILGSAFGGLAVYINDRMVELRTEKLQKINDRLNRKIHEDRVEYERSEAYRRGYAAAARK